MGEVKRYRMQGQENAVVEVTPAGEIRIIINANGQPYKKIDKETGKEKAALWLASIKGFLKVPGTNVRITFGAYTTEPKEQATSSIVEL
jgi:hypothetical protein